MKKDGTRFTIRFNPVDPRQFRAMNALEAAGRRKSTLIADAVCEYLERRGGNSEALAPSIATVPAIPTRPQNKALEEDSFSQISESTPAIEKNHVDSDTDYTLFDDEINDAILDGLAAFNL